MNIPLKRKYTVYNGDLIENGKVVRTQVQYGTGRAGGGNGKRAERHVVTEDFKMACAKQSKGVVTPPKVMVVNGLTGHKVMVSA